LPRIETKKNIKASVERIFEILNDTDIMPKWNIAVKSVEKLDEGKYFVKSNVGDLTSYREETVPNVSITERQEGSILKRLGYILKPKGDVVEATIWGEFDDPSQEPMMMIAGDVFLKSLKKFAEYLETGGNPEEFKKK